MDYPSQQRLKIWAEASIIEVGQDTVEMPGYKARIERLVVLAVLAYDWNCPQHITPRYKVEEIKALTG